MVCGSFVLRTAKSRIIIYVLTDTRVHASRCVILWTTSRCVYNTLYAINYDDYFVRRDLHKSSTAGGVSNVRSKFQENHVRFPWGQPALKTKLIGSPFIIIFYAGVHVSGRGGLMSRYVYV